MGVRYNAEKKKVGMYYSTPVYQFRMKCHLCDNHFEIKTDPGNLDYVIISGARRQENRWDPTQNEQIVPETKETQKRLFDDPMFKLEHGAKDAKAADDAKPAISKLFQRNQDVWKDCYEANAKLRAAFRKSKKETRDKDLRDQEILKRSSLDIKLLPENEDDKKMATLLRLHAPKSIKDKEKEKQNEILNKPALPGATITSFGGLKREAQMKKGLITNLGIRKRKAVDELNEPSTSKIPKTSGLSLLGTYSSSSSSESD